MKERITFIKGNGYRIEGMINLPDSQGPFPTVIFSHGFGATFRNFTHHADAFARSGVAFVAFDFCGGGPDSLSDGSMQEMNILSEMDDLRVVIEKTLELEFVDKEAVFLMGESMGGMVSALVAPEFKYAIAGQILWYPAFVIPDDSRKRFEKGDNTALGIQLAPDFNETAMNIDVYNIISEYTGPVLMIHGDEDKLVPISYSGKAQRVYKNAALTVLHGAGHGFDGDDSMAAQTASIRFVQANCNPVGERRITDYNLLSQSLIALIEDVPHTIANLANAAALIYEAMVDVNWAGFYKLKGEKLILGPFQGKPACIEIPVGHGVCGTAVKIRKTIVVEDVHNFPGHIPCDSASRSEIVVPLFKNGKVYGVRDLDSPKVNRFTPEDKEGLERIASIIEKAISCED
ncbi:MAG: alpha/beta hydrolase [Lachnospiraceae bacterium]|nr:alpha/beta hydrolase [Lachnospiraceae bacterium]